MQQVKLDSSKQQRQASIEIQQSNSRLTGLKTMQNYMYQSFCA